MIPIFILLLDFKDGSDADLVTFATVVIIRTSGVSGYEAVKVQVDQVVTSLGEFNVAVSNAMSGGASEKVQRNQKRAVLENNLELLGNALIDNSNGEVAYVTDTHFRVRDNQIHRSMQPLPNPKWKILERGVLSGTLKGESTNFPKGCTGIQVQWKLKGQPDEAYVMGLPASGKRFNLEGLPILTKVEVRYRFIGTFQRISNWSTEITIEVL